MRIVSVTAQAFGPLHGQTLELAPGMTVLHGPNESAKSSWHAAIHAALCGRRRGRGPGSGEEHRRWERHRPWQGSGWVVRAVVELADGRTVELRQDLDGKVDCRATDLVLGSDLSAEIMGDGSPDAARWLGLDRRSFAATASVSQTQLAAVRDAADGLRHQLQRAASTAGTADQTAAAARQRLEVFSREHVGVDRAGSGRPMRAARDTLAAALVALDDARREHAHYLELLSGADQRRRTADDARAAADQAHQRLDQGRTLLTAAQEAARRRLLARQVAERATAVARELSREERRLEQAGALGGTAAPSRTPAVLPRRPAAVSRRRRGVGVPEVRGMGARGMGARGMGARGMGARGMGALAVVALLGVALLFAGAGVYLALGGRAGPGAVVTSLGVAALGLAVAGALRRCVPLADAAVTRDGVTAAVVLLDGQTMAELAAEVSRLRTRAADCADAAHSALLEADDSDRRRGELWARWETTPAAVLPRDHPEGPLPDRGAARSCRDDPPEALADLVAALENEATAAQSRAAGLAASAEKAAGALAERTRSMPSVVEAEERVAAARAEVARVEQLRATLDLTSSFLATAEQRVHRDVAPVLAATLRNWLPSITAGRYDDALVDPATLAVQVRAPGGDWRSADRLSVGTTEAVYLLLRVALAEHLTLAAESCPLLLDDITVQSDAARTDATLAMLHRLSADRQVVLFAQEAAVACWARAHLTTDRDAFRLLEQLPVG